MSDTRLVVHMNDIGFAMLRIHFKSKQKKYDLCRQIGYTMSFPQSLRTVKQRI